MADPEKAFFEVVEPAGDKIYFMFNPEKLKISRKNKWDTLKQPGKGVKMAVFKGSDPGSLQLGEMWFDTTDTGQPVSKYTDKLMALLDIDKNVPRTNPNTNNARPSVVKFHWGQMVSFPCYVESVDVEFTYFSAAGVHRSRTGHIA
jgi:hypothetical protein